MNVTVEFADRQHPARAVARAVDDELHRRLRRIVDGVGVADPEELTDQLVMLINGAFSSAQCMGRDGPQRLRVKSADALVDAALARK